MVKNLINYTIFFIRNHFHKEPRLKLRKIKELLRNLEAQFWNVPNFFTAHFQNYFITGDIFTPDYT